MANPDEFRSAGRRGAFMRPKQPPALVARYDRRTDRVIVSLARGLEIGFAPHSAQGLEKARPTDLATIEVSPSGFGLHFPKLDANIYLPALVEGFLGSKRWIASEHGKLGGSVAFAAQAA